jgi:copper chaperone NosL
MNTARGIFVADRDTRLLLDVDQQIWVIGGKKRGVLTQVPKWAFASRSAAQSLIEANGGVIATWAEMKL